MENTLVRSIVEQQKNQAAAGQEKSFQQNETDRLIHALTGLLAEVLVSRNNNTQNVHALNLPEVQRVLGMVSIDEAPKVTLALEAIMHAIHDNKLELPEVQKVAGEVTVTNQPVIPEVKIPEYPKQIKTDVTSLPKYVADGFDKVTKAVQALEVSPQVNVETKPADVNIDLSEITASLEELYGMLAVLVDEVSKDDEPADFSEVTMGLAAVQTAIESIRFPVPNFQSSWQHSLDMQSKDMPMTYTYTTVAGTKVISYLEFVAKNGHTYRKTFGYASSDPANPDSSTGWIKQDSL